MAAAAAIDGALPHLGAEGAFLGASTDEEIRLRMPRNIRRSRRRGVVEQDF